VGPSAFASGVAGGVEHASKRDITAPIPNGARATESVQGAFTTEECRRVIALRVHGHDSHRAADTRDRDRCYASAMKITIPRALAVTAIAAGSAAAAAIVATTFEACQSCPPVEACYYDFQQNPDGGTPIGCYRRQFPDGGVTCTSEQCPPVPQGCPVA
jgi:hypothetical protein